jgi:hypothetical protein
LLLDLVFQISQILLELNAELLGFRYTDVLALVTSLKAPFDVQVVVFDDSQNDVRGGDAICSLSGSEHSKHLDLVVNVLLASANIW